MHASAILSSGEHTVMGLESRAASALATSKLFFTI